MLETLRKAASSLAGRIQTCHCQSKAQTWEALADHARYNIWSGDHFVDPEDQTVVYQVRAIPREFFVDACHDAPGIIHQMQPASRLRIL